jgi:hypothetical protein
MACSSNCIRTPLLEVAPLARVDTLIAHDQKFLTEETELQNRTGVARSSKSVRTVAVAVVVIPIFSSSRKKKKKQKSPPPPASLRNVRIHNGSLTQWTPPRNLLKICEGKYQD